MARRRKHPSVIGRNKLVDYLGPNKVEPELALRTSVPGVVHVLGMFTLPERRRRGLARVIIEALHREARARGATWSVLNASLEAARAEVYPRLGYETLLRGARLIPERAPD